MKRRLFTLAVAVSLVLCLVTVGLWVRSYWQPESIAYIDDIDDGTTRFIWASDLPDRPEWSRAMWHDEWRVISAGGIVSIYHNRSDTPFRSGSWRRKGWHHASGDWSTRLGGMPGSLAWAGFSYASWGKGPPKMPQGVLDIPWSYTRVVTFPHWLFVLATAILPAFWLHRSQRARKSHRSSLCTTCGYDLRATPERCPECGTVPTAANRGEGVSPSRQS